MAAATVGSFGVAKLGPRRMQAPGAAVCQRRTVADAGTRLAPTGRPRHDTALAVDGRTRDDVDHTVDRIDALTAAAGTADHFDAINSSSIASCTSQNTPENKGE
jgi:hypothetical protein